MTPQSNFMIVATIDPQREADLRSTLASMNKEPGVVDPTNNVVPFHKLHNLHFARFVILKDETQNDIAAYGLTPIHYPVYLVFLGDVDGEMKTFFAQIVEQAGYGLRGIFSHCENFSSKANLLDWMKA